MTGISLSEMMTLVVLFQQLRHRQFKVSYLDYVHRHLRAEFSPLEFVYRQAVAEMCRAYGRIVRMDQGVLYWPVDHQCYTAGAL